MCYTFGFILLVAVCLYVVSFCYVLLCVCVYLKKKKKNYCGFDGFLCVCESVFVCVCLCARVCLSVCLSGCGQG